MREACIFHRRTIRGVVIAYRPQAINSWIQRALDDGNYEAPEATMVKAAVRDGDRVLDLGAGLGFTSVLASLCGASFVHAYEANPEIFDSLKRTIDENGVSNVSSFMLAVSSKVRSGIRPFFVREGFWSSSLSSERKSFKSVVECEVVPLSKIVESFSPDVIICDCEGEEHEMLLDLPGSGVRSLVVEVHRCGSSFELPIIGFREMERLTNGPNSFVVRMERL